MRGLKYKNVAAGLLAKLLGDEIKVRSKRNLVQSREFSEVLKKTLNAYHNRAKRILRKHGYSPDIQDEATKLVLQQAELLCAEWAA